MAVIYVGTYPYDPELELKNFQQKQAEYEAAWRATSDPLVLNEALQHARAARQLTPDRLVDAVSGAVMKGREGRKSKKGQKSRKGRASPAAKRLRERMLHVQRYRCVRDLRQKGHIKEDALDLAVEVRKAAGDPATRPTIEDSYDRVSSDLNRAGCESEYSLLVARSDPTVVPVSVIQRPNGVTINGVEQ